MSFCPKQGQGFKPPAAPLYPNMGQVPPPPSRGKALLASWMPKCIWDIWKFPEFVGIWEMQSRALGIENGFEGPVRSAKSLLSSTARSGILSCLQVLNCAYPLHTPVSVIHYTRLYRLSITHACIGYPLHTPVSVLHCTRLYRLSITHACIGYPLHTPVSVLHCTRLYRLSITHACIGSPLHSLYRLSITHACIGSPLHTPVSVIHYTRLYRLSITHACIGYPLHTPVSVIHYTRLYRLSIAHACIGYPLHTPVSVIHYTPVSVIHYTRLYRLSITHACIGYPYFFHKYYCELITNSSTMISITNFNHVTSSCKEPISLIFVEDCCVTMFPQFNVTYL